MEKPLFSCYQPDVTAIQEVEIDNAQGLDVAVVEGLADDGDIQFLHGLCLCSQLHELLCTKCHQRIGVVQLGFPMLQKVLSVLQHGIPCHHKGFVQVGFQERVIDAPLTEE